MITENSIKMTDVGDSPGNEDPDTKLPKFEIRTVGKLSLLARFGKLVHVTETIAYSDMHTDELKSPIRCVK